MFLSIFPSWREISYKIFLFMSDKITLYNFSSFNITRFLYILLKTVLQFQSRHNSHTGHCYMMSLAAGKRLDVIITIMKTVQCYVSCPPGMLKVWVRNVFRSLRSRNCTPPSKPWRPRPTMDGRFDGALVRYDGSSPGNRFDNTLLSSDLDVVVGCRPA